MAQAWNKQNLSGMRFGRLTVLEEHGRQHRKVVWKCLCDCGNLAYVISNNLKKGNSRSCGCLSIENSRQIGLGNLQHGYEKHPLYGTRAKILRRCYSQGDKDFKNYGARGIGVCDEWRTNVASFIEWALKNGWKRGLQIDRKNNNDSYSPQNCRIVTAKVNSRNTRLTKMIAINNETKPLAEWAEIYGMKYVTLYARIFRYGWAPEKAVGGNHVI